jgi:hypothetical protein
VTAAVVAALPFGRTFGWGLGVTAAYLLAGSDFGQLPALTVPVAIITVIVLALLPLLSARKRLLIMVAGTGFFILLGPLTRRRTAEPGGCLQPTLVHF